MSKPKQVYERFRDLLKAEFKIKELGKPKHILGVRVEFVKNGISLSHFLLPQKKQGLHTNGAPFDSQKVSGI